MTTNQPLSQLQNEILKIAQGKKYVGYPDVLQQVYGFIPSAYGKLLFTDHRAVRKEIRAARVSICKSFNRLVKRGVVRRIHNYNQALSCITLVHKRG